MTNNNNEDNKSEKHLNKKDESDFYKLLNSGLPNIKSSKSSNKENTENNEQLSLKEDSSANNSSSSSNEEQDTHEKDNISPGKILQKERKKKNIKLKEIALILNMSARFIEYLEQDNYGMLPNETFIRGYIRSYAQELGLNSEELVELYVEKYSKEPSSNSNYRKTKIIQNYNGPSIYNMPDPNKVNKKNILAIIAIVVILIGIVALIFGIGRGNNINVIAKNPISLNEQNNQEDKIISITNTKSKQNINDQYNKDYLTNKNILAKITIISKSNTWLEINTESNKNILSKLLNSDDIIEFNMTDTILISIGSANELILEINGVKIDLKPFINLRSNIARFKINNDLQIEKI